MYMTICVYITQEYSDVHDDMCIYITQEYSDVHDDMCIYNSGI